MISARWWSRWRKKSTAAFSSSMGVPVRRWSCSALAPWIEAEPAKEGDEAHVGNGRVPEFAALLLDQGEHLLLLIAERNYQTPAGRQLFQKRLGHRRRCRQPGWRRRGRR